MKLVKEWDYKRPTVVFSVAEAIQSTCISHDSGGQLEQAKDELSNLMTVLSSVVEMLVDAGVINYAQLRTIAPSFKLTEAE